MRRQGSLWVAFLIVLASAVAPSIAEAQGRRYWVESFDADIRVMESGDIDITERLTFRFEGSFNGVYRDIPIKYATPRGLDYRLRLTPVSVTAGNGDTLRHEAGTQGDDFRFKVWVTDANNATRTVVLRYRVSRALRFPDMEEGFESHDQLYWNVTGMGWTVPILAATAQISLPGGLSQPPWALAYTGPYGSQAHGADIENLAINTVRVSTRGRLEPGEGLTIVVGWPAGLVYRPTALDQACDLLADNWPLGLPFLAFLGMFMLHRRRGRDPRTGESVMVRYEPPADFRPAELGTLIDERVDLRDIVATVIDLAVRGYLKIEETVEEGWLRDTTKTTFERLPPPQEDTLRAYEKSVLDGLFESGERVDMGDLKSKFYSRVSGIKDELYSSMTKRGLFRSRPDRSRTTWLVLALVSLLPMILFAVVFQKPAMAIAAPFTALAIGVFAPFMPARTATGRSTYVALKGFEEFLGRTEADRFKALGISETSFERYLPYAMAFGVADHWAKLFEGMLSKPPTWYAGPTPHFSPSSFGTRMGSMGSALGTAMATQPRSSSGSSGFSSGGGFSGGGFGGGGGGAF
ncbi:MAG TPA: DUF2207 domain-containing protein [Acidobacteriota bacterium]|nr:DUF2207 domain-containing protein [Acidobacteriota bacterium]